MNDKRGNASRLATASMMSPGRYRCQGQTDSPAPGTAAVSGGTPKAHRDPTPTADVAVVKVCHHPLVGRARRRTSHRRRTRLVRPVSASATGYRCTPTPDAADTRPRTQRSSRAFDEASARTGDGKGGSVCRLLGVTVIVVIIDAVSVPAVLPGAQRE